MRNSKWMLLVGLLLFLLFTNCYTVVLTRRQEVRHVETEDAIYEEEAYEDIMEEYEDEADAVIHDTYYYGDLWTDYVAFDPFWTSPYWWYYPSWSRWHWWYYSYSGFYDPWYWHRYGWYYDWYYPYYWYGYYDPYWSGCGYYDPYWGGNWTGDGDHNPPTGEGDSFGITRVRNSSGSSVSKPLGHEVNVTRIGDSGTRTKSLDPVTVTRKDPDASGSSRLRRRIKTTSIKNDGTSRKTSATNRRTIKKRSLSTKGKTSSRSISTKSSKSRQSSQSGSSGSKSYRSSGSRSSGSKSTSRTSSSSSGSRSRSSGSSKSSSSSRTSTRKK